MSVLVEFPIEEAQAVYDVLDMSRDAMSLASEAEEIARRKGVVRLKQALAVEYGAGGSAESQPTPPANIVIFGGAVFEAVKAS